MLIKAALLFAAVVTPVLSASWIVPGAVWTDTSGAKIDAHGGQILKVNGVFYWVGQAWSSNTSPNLYSSTDLLNWKHEGLANSIQWMYRPKLFQSGGKFYIWGQINRNVQALVSSSVNSGYSVYGNAFSLPPNSYTYSDGGIFVDDDGSAYYLTSADHNNLQINHINGGSTVSIGTRASVVQGAYEAPGMMKADGIYYLIVSAKTGYRPDPDQQFWATSPAGPWTGPSDIAPSSTNTYGSQNTFELKISGSSTTTYVYMGDAWDSAGDAGSNYEWLPISVNSGSKAITLVNQAMWKVDVNTGLVSTAKAQKRYEAENAIIAGRAAVTHCESCASKRAVHKIDSMSNVTFTGIEGTGEPQWVAFHYTVNNATYGDAHVHVNGEKIRIKDLNQRAGSHPIVPINLTLRRGTDNVITFSSAKRVEAIDDFEAHLDGIEVFED